MYRLIRHRKDGLKVEYYDLLCLDGPSRQDTQLKTYVDVAEGPHRHKIVSSTHRIDGLNNGEKVAEAEAT